MPYYVEQAGHGGTDQFGEDRPIYCMRICTGTDNCPVTEDTAGCRTTMGIDFTQAYGFTYQDNRNGVTGPVITSNYTVPTTTTAVATTVGTKTSVASQSTTVASTTSSGALGMSVVVVQFFIFPALFII
ncbi:hypothetical protein HK100_009703 [Physocladia obscura]|uniref:Uncharacterized protein n=1 Tax=Physocladia obscura TaxID=109957 RepID=A0AAD5T5Q7_9FUNG|nr:hypothetical protein HK100_009703 [Physocladia obscura]